MGTTSAPTRAHSHEDQLLALLLALTALACDRAGTTHSFKDEGRLCLFPAGSTAGTPFGPQTEPRSYPADGALRLEVLAPTCLSSSCSHDRKAECSVVVTGNTIEVKSVASFREEGDTCTADCGALVATCSTPPLPAGTYQVRHGATTLTLTVPSMASPPCGGKGL